MMDEIDYRVRLVNPTLSSWLLRFRPSPRLKMGNVIHRSTPG